MRILVTNDDGYLSPGIAVLRDAAAAFGEVTVVAPLANHSGASSSLTLTADVAVHRKEAGVYAVAGTPTDCVHLALTGDILPQRPDLVVSGINDGANMGDDTIYSGTVAAAIEGHLFGVPALAFSMAAKPVRSYDAGGAAARLLLERFCRARPGGAFLLNVNVPDVPAAELRGMQHTRLGRRHAAEPAVLKERGADYFVYAIGEAGAARDGGWGTDFYAVEQGYVSVTPLAVDLTAFSQIGDVAQWLSC